MNPARAGGGSFLFGWRKRKLPPLFFWFNLRTLKLNNNFWRINGNSWPACPYPQTLLISVINTWGYWCGMISTWHVTIKDLMLLKSYFCSFLELFIELLHCSNWSSIYKIPTNSNQSFHQYSINLEFPFWLFIIQVNKQRI